MDRRQWKGSVALGAAVWLAFALAAHPAPGADEPREKMPCQMMGSGMMQGGMMGPGMMGPQMMAPGMMPGGMMGRGGMPCMMMGQGAEGMMRGCDKGCLSMSGGMMMGQFDLGAMKQALGLSEEQADKVRALQRPMQKAAIASVAALKTAELDLADLLASDKADLGKVEAVLKVMEAERTKMILGQIRAAQELKSILSREQMEKYQSCCRMGRVAEEPPQEPGGPPEKAAPEHQQHHQ